MTDSNTAVLTHQALLLIPLAPLLGSALVYLLCNRSEKLHALSGWIATLAAAIAFGVTANSFFVLNEGSSEALTAHAWNWFTVRNISVDFAFRFDKLASVMTLIVTGVGSLIHLYAIGYMAEDENRPRFFSYLNLFLFAMLLLVLGDNLLVMFVGWEGVGLCSYLLIGFWFKDMENAKAGQKAFVVNRIGDAGFLLGMFILALSTGSVAFVGIESSMALLSEPSIQLAALLLFVGAVGKSAQIPLYIWLPDAMAGPTPVSALIHAATMVTAGIYMIARMHFLFIAAPDALLVISIVGTATAFLAATIALVQNDIKKVLAYSTVSQLGYMFMAMGAGAFSNGIYHVVTHAFFKACLFMAAGSVIIGCHHEQDMRQYGGLWKKMPLTFISYFVATLAIAGFPFLSGFYSKDAILWTVYSNTSVAQSFEVFSGVPLHHFFWGAGLLTAFLTAFYMTRSLVMTFFGSYRGHEHPHESPWVVTAPLLILAGLSAVFGALWGESMMHYLATWTRPDMALGHEVLAENETYHFLEQLSIAVAIGGILLASIVYGAFPAAATHLSKRFRLVHEFLLNKWWVDEFFAAIVVRPLRGISALLFSVVDRFLIDGTVNGTGVFAEANGELLRRFHVGRTSFYASFMITGMLFGIIFWMVL